MTLSLFANLITATPINVNPNAAASSPLTARNHTTDPKIDPNDPNTNPFLPGNAPVTSQALPNLPTEEEKKYTPLCIRTIGLNLDADEICNTRKYVFEGHVLGVHCVGDNIALEGIDPYEICAKEPLQNVNAIDGWTPGCKCVEVKGAVGLEGPAIYEVVDVAEE